MKLKKAYKKFKPFDYQYNLNLFAASLLETAKCLKEGITVSGEQDAKDIKWFVKQITTDDYDAFKKAHPDYIKTHPDKKVAFARKTQWGIARQYRIWKFFADKHQGWWQ